MLKNINFFNNPNNKIILLFISWYFIVTPIVVSTLIKFIDFQTLPKNQLYFIGIIIAPLTYYLVYLIYKFLYYDKHNFYSYIKNQFKSFKVEYFKGILYGFSLLAFIIIINLLFNIIFKSQIESKADNVQGLLSVPFILTFLIGTIIIPFIEELVFRVGIKELFKDSYNKYNYIIVSSLLFAFVHIQNTGNIIQMINYILVAFISGIIFAIIYDRNNSIWPSFFTHFTYNFIILALQFL